MKILLLFLCVVLSSPAFAGFSTVVIDAGHGGHDRGGIPGQRVPEKAVVLDIALRLSSYLREAGFRTVMTRTSDTFISLPQRVAIANSQSNAVFVSIHTNSATRVGACGYETYYYQPRAARLAYRVQAQLCRVISTENRGVKQRGFYVLRKTRIPAVLAECGFLTNPTEARLALTAAYRQRIANAIGPRRGRVQRPLAFRLAMILSCEEMRALEEKTIASGVSAETLMEQAGLQIANAVRQFFQTPGRCLVFFGKGHNGGDALVGARHLAESGWNIELRPAFPSDVWAELTTQKHRELLSTSRQPAGGSGQPVIALDGLLGIGAGGALREPILTAVREINRLRAATNTHVFAMDLPTGLNADTGEADPDCVVADFTLTVGYAKSGLLADHAANFVGRLAVLTMTLFAEQEFSAGDDSEVATPENLAPLLPRRNFDSHKTDYGRVAIIAGSRGFTGAAIMTAEAALRAGAGLITLFVTEDIYPITAAAAPPEIMVHPVASYREVLDSKRDVLAIGPGLGTHFHDDVLHLIQTCPEPMVIDADALNILATKIETLRHCAGPRLLTPHPGEMSRLFATQNQARREIAKAFTEEFPVTLLLKGSRTVIGEKGRPFSYNSTGSPGMATGGMGDMLTGVCAALIAQGRSPFDAARLGAWLCGRAAELAICSGNRSEESLAATDVIVNLGAAFKELRGGCC